MARIIRELRAQNRGSWKTSQRSLISGAWMSYSQTSGRVSGMMRAGEVLQSITIHGSAHHIAGSGGSVSRGWPTEDRNAMGDSAGKATSEQAGQIGSEYLPVDAYLAKCYRAWPTPSAQIFDQSPEVFDARRERLKAKGVNGNGAGRLLAVEVRRSWPTPSATDHKGSSKPGQRRGQLTEPLEPGSGGRLNPAWVESLMGFPPGWTSPDAGLPHQDHNTLGNHRAPDHDNPTTGSD